MKAGKSMPKIKEVLVLHHSHLDIGYTHAQPIILELQKKYIDQALHMCELTEDWSEVNKFRWTCESSYPVLSWLETAKASQIDRFKHYLHKGQMSISASHLHTTPLCSAEQMAKMLYPVSQLRSQFDIEIKTAIHHDVNGQPWPYSQLLLDAGVEFFIMGINMHMGAIPFARPSAFHWETPDRRKLLTFHGEHYALFSEICDVNAKNTNIMANGLNKYLQKIEANPEYPFDFIYLTATNLPLYDNNPPDRELAELIKIWNGEGREQTITFVTPEQLYARVKQHETQLHTHSGDWTDYWNFGSGSSAKETKLNRRTKQGMRAVELLEAFQGEEDQSHQQLKKQAWEQINLYDEHTWGAFNSIYNPHHLNVDIQWSHKSHYAYQANSLTGYLLGNQMERLANNPLQSEEPEGLLLVNTSSVPVKHDIQFPSGFRIKGRHLSADRMRHVLMNNDRNHASESYGIVELAPFSWRKFPFQNLQKVDLANEIASHPGKMNEIVAQFSVNHAVAGTITSENGYIETPYHRFIFDPSKGRILSLYDKLNDWEVLDVSSPWTLFQYVQETIDPIHDPVHRSTLFPCDFERSKNSISNWNHDWHAKRETYSRFKSFHLERSANNATLVMQWEAPGMDRLEQRFTFFSYRADIEMKVSYVKQDITTPEGTYFAIPLNVKDWRCIYDTAGQIVELDEQQLPGVCRDYITVDKSVSIFDGSHGVTLVCPDAPLVQVGDFNFGREHHKIDRDSRPLLLAWPMNNYWETNFRAHQPGFNSFTYYLSTFQTFDPANVLQSSAQAIAPVYTTAVMNCREDVSGQFIQLSGTGVQIFDVKPAEEGKGIIVRLSNCTEQSVNAQLIFPSSKIKTAFRTNALEENQMEIRDIQHGTLEVKLEAKQMLHLRVILEE